MLPNAAIACAPRSFRESVTHRLSVHELVEASRPKMRRSKLLRVSKHVDTPENRLIAIHRLPRAKASAAFALVALIFMHARRALPEAMLSTRLPFTTKISRIPSLSIRQKKPVKPYKRRNASERHERLPCVSRRKSRERTIVPSACSVPIREEHSSLSLSLNNRNNHNRRNRRTSSRNCLSSKDNHTRTANRDKINRINSPGKPLALLEQ